jgi:uncharacterized protein
MSPHYSYFKAQFIGKILLLAGICLLLTTPVWSDYESGSAAYSRGDYKNAFRQFERLAKKGDGKAQILLGRMYQRGEGVPEDHAKAAKWFRRAAEQGLSDAQFFLGCIYEKGQGVEQDYTQAYMWYSLATDQGNKVARRFRNALGKKMSPERIAQAQEMSKSFKSKAGNK